MIDRLLAFLRSKMQMLTGLIVGAIIGVFLIPMLMPAPVLIDVKIYEMEDGSYTYCASGTLTDPPARYVGTGAVPDGDESYC